MKSADFFKKLKETGKINSTELDKFLENVPDFEFPDKAFEAFENSFMTLDRAAAHPEVNKKLRAELLDPMDRSIEKALDFELKDYLDHATIQELKGEKSTYKKVEMLAPKILDAIKKIKASGVTDETTKKQLQTLEETKSDLLKKIQAMNSEFEGKEKELKTGFEKNLNDYKLNGELEKLANSYTLADAFTPTRGAITKVTLAELRSKHQFALGEKDGQHEVQVVDKDGKPIFQGNTQVSIKNLLDQAFEPFVKKSNSNEGQQGQQGQETQRFSVDNGGKATGRQGVRTTVQ